MSETPPPYAQYPRGDTAAYGSSAQLQSLYDAYRQYSWLFLANILISFGIFGFLGFATGGSNLVLLGYVVVPLVLGFLSYPINRKLGFGANWSSAQVLVASVLMGLNSICCGIIGFGIVQQIAINHMKRYGLRVGFLGIRKRELRAKVEDLRTAESGTSAHPRL